MGKTPQCWCGRLPSTFLSQGRDASPERYNPGISQKEAAWREKLGDKFLLERVGAFCSLGSHREHSLTTWEMVGGCGLWRPPRDIPAPLQHQGWGYLSQYQRNRSEDSGHPVGYRPGYSPIFLALTRLSYPFYPADDNRGSPK